MRYPAIESRIQALESPHNNEQKWHLCLARTHEEMDEKVAAAPPGSHILRLWVKSFRKPEAGENGDNIKN